MPHCARDLAHPDPLRNMSFLYLTNGETKAQRVNYFLMDAASKRRNQDLNPGLSDTRGCTLNQ